MMHVGVDGCRWDIPSGTRAAAEPAPATFASVVFLGCSIVVYVNVWFVVKWWVYVWWQRAAK